MVLYGPTGIGKTTLLLELEERFRAARIRCVRAPLTHGLDNITGALELAFPKEIGRTDAGGAGRWWPASQLQGGVLLLDHLTQVSDDMVGFLRWLRGGIMGVMTAVDVDMRSADGQRLRPGRLGTLSIRMPGTSGEVLHKLLHQQVAGRGLPELDADTQRRLVRAAEGRPGWILKCAQLQSDDRYRKGSQLLVSELCAATEQALRQQIPAGLPRAERQQTSNSVLRE